MAIRVATPADIEAWANMRIALWPDTGRGEHLDEIRDILARVADCVAFLGIGEDGQISAFAEAALRRDHVNGCDSSPVAFLEGIYVAPEHRLSGIGRELLKAVQAWARDKGCTELASDAHLDNLDSHAFHAAFGFQETERVVFFRKPL